MTLNKKNVLLKIDKLKQLSLGKGATFVILALISLRVLEIGLDLILGDGNGRVSTPWLKLSFTLFNVALIAVFIFYTFQVHLLLNLSSKFRSALVKIFSFIASLRNPAIVLAFYFFSFSYFVSSIQQLPNGVSYVFAMRLWVPLVSIGILIFLLMRNKNAFFNNVKQKSSKTIDRSDLVLLLLPLTPILHYIFNNQKILTISDSLYVFLYFLVFSAIYIFSIPALLGKLGSTRSLLTVGTAFAFSITSMAFISDYFSWYESGNLVIQILFIATVFLILNFVYIQDNLAALKIFIVVFFLANFAPNLISSKETSENLQSNDTNELSSIIEDRFPVKSPNIYLLVYDAYVANETMLSHGIDNYLQEEYLIANGFKIYPKTYSISPTSESTMTRVLNVSSDILEGSRQGTSGDGFVQNKLNELGYQTLGIFPSDFFFRGIGSSYDVSFPDDSSPKNVLLNAILIGEFRFDVGFDVSTYDEYIYTKRLIFERASEEPIFLYSHSNLPGHSQNSGSCLPDESERFSARLVRANSEMQEDLSQIIKNDSSAIVIVAGDHGPYLTKNCYRTGGRGYSINEISRLDLQDRFGSFLAIRWPEGNFERFDDITVLQDLFPAIFAYLYDDEGILVSKIAPVTIESDVASGAGIQNGIILGGINDGEPLFLLD